MRVGDKVDITAVRNGRTIAVSTRLGDRRDVALDARTLSERLTGATLSDIPEGSPLKGRVDGVLVVEVEQNSIAWRYGLRPGDVIVAVNRIRVRNLEEIRKTVREGGRALVLNIQRGNGSVFILIQ